MGKGKGTDHVVNVHGCISACVELVLPSKCYHPMGLLGSVLLCLPLLHLEGGEPFGFLRVSGVLF